MTIPTACEATEEQRAKAHDIANRWGSFTHRHELRNAIAQALAQESSREHERAEAMEKQLAEKDETCANLMEDGKMSHQDRQTRSSGRRRIGLFS